MSVSVIIPAREKRLTTLANVRMDLGGVMGAPSDQQVDRFILQASQMAATFCQRTFGRETVSERFDASWDNQATDREGILLDCYPVVSILSVKAGGMLLSPDAYAVDGRVLYRLDVGERRGWAGSGIVVQYEAGWLLPSEERGSPPTTTADDLPADIERAVVQLVGAFMSAAGRDPMVKSQDVEGIGSRSFYVQGATSALPHPEAEAVLARYRRLGL